MIKTKDIHHKVVFNTKPKKLYEILLDPKRLALIGNAPAKVSKKAFGKFYLKGWWYGINLDCVPGKRIVQAWRWEQKEFGAWPEGHFSIVSYELIPANGGTELEFHHVGVPAPAYKIISNGWKKFHWEPIKKMLKEKKKDLPPKR